MIYDKKRTKLAATTTAASSHIVEGKQFRDRRHAVERIEKNLMSPSLMMIVLLAVVGSINYGFFLWNPNNRGDLIPYILVILAESFILFQAFLSLWTILASNYNPRNYEFHDAQDHLFGGRTKSMIARTKQKKFGYDANMPVLLHGQSIKVDVFVPVYGEDVAVIEATLIAARDIMGAHGTYVLDDGKSDEVKALAKRIGVTYVRRDGSHGAKAGNINAALRSSKADYFVILDADFVPSQMFLYETMPFFENDKVAFVQTPQHYRNTHNIISEAAGYMQHVFYSLIQPGKNRFNAAFCVGTNVVFRRSAVDAVGGIYDKSKSEDIWTSILLHEKGYESIYIANVLAIGATPDTIEAYSKQQLRWATGGFEIMLRHNPLFRRGLSVDQRLQYLATVTYYLNGFAVLALLMLPALQIYFNLTPVNLNISFVQWALYYSSFYLLQIAVAFFAIGGFKLQTILIASVSAPIYVRAFFNALFKRDQSWQATGATGTAQGRHVSPFNFIFPQMYIWVFLVFTTIVGFWKGAYLNEYAVSLFWNVLNTVAFSTFILIAWRESRRLKAQARTGANSQSTKHLKAATS